MFHYILIYNIINIIYNYICIHYIIRQPFWQKQRNSKERYLWPSFSYWILETPVPKNLPRILTLEEEKGESDICHSRNLFKRKRLHITIRSSCRRDWSSALMDHTLNRTAHFCTPFLQFCTLFDFLLNWSQVKALKMEFWTVSLYLFLFPTKWQRINTSWFLSLLSIFN